MRTVITNVVVSVLLGSFTGAAAQLPPEIMADSYLLRVEQAVRDGDQAQARAVIQKILELQKEHELDLPDEFHFRYAKAASAADLPEQAHEAVVKYLTLAGREGKHYQEALELMNQVQDAIGASKEPLEASNEPVPEPAQVAKQGPIEDQLDADGNPGAQEDKGTLITAGAPTEAQPAPDCGHWKTKYFFRTATLVSVTACLAAGADPMARHHKYGDTPLHFAARYNKNPAVIEALLKAGADPMAQQGNWNKTTPLHLAAMFNENPAVIEALLKAGADPMAHNWNKTTPLHLAARFNANPETIKALIDVGIDARAVLKWSALHEAAALNETPAVIEVLLKAGADPAALDKYKSTPLHLAARYNKNPAVSEALLKAGADPAALDKYKSTPLHLAARYNKNPAVSEALLKAGADPMAQTKRKRTPLHLAASNNENSAIIEALLKAGADPAALAKFKNTPLHLAAYNNENPAVVEALLKAGADSMARDKNRGTPLHDAARSNENPAVVEALLAAGADPMARDKRKRTPLHDAARNNETPAVTEALLKAGANLAALDENGHTPLREAKKWNDNPAVAHVLLAAGAGQVERQVAAAQARRKAKSGPGFLEAAIGIAGGTAIAAAGGGTDEAVKAGTVFAESVLAGQQPVANAGGGAAAGGSAPAGNTGRTAGGGSCQIPGYPRPANPRTLGLAWCPAQVDFQRRVFALQAAGAQCAMATGSSSTPEQIQARRQEIKSACDRLDALQSPDIPTCQCPAGLRP